MSAQKIRTLLKTSGSLRKIENEAEQELITDIRNRDQGFLLLFFCFFCLFVCSFLKVMGGGGENGFSFSYVSLAFYFLEMSGI